MIGIILITLFLLIIAWHGWSVKILIGDITLKYEQYPISRFFKKGD